MSHRHPPLDFSRITNEIYIGTNACCQTHFDHSLLKKGIRADVSLEKERLETPWGVDYFLWLPTRDHTPPALSQLAVGVAALRELVRAKVKVYVHCKNGHGRGPTLVAAYLIVERGMTPKEAIAFVKKRRPAIHLEPSQVQRLMKFFKISTNEARKST